MKQIKTIILILGLAIGLTSCLKEPISSNQTNNSEFKIDLLFEKDGHKIYRFYDNGTYHYFVIGNGIVESNRDEDDQTITETIQTLSNAK